MAGEDRSPWAYRPLDEEIRHFRIVSDKYKQLQTELVRSLQAEQRQRRELEMRLQQALEGERMERERSQGVLVAAMEYVRLDHMATDLREENKKLKEEVQELKARAEVEAGMAAARTAAWEAQLKEASRRSEQELQATKEVAREACEEVERRAKQEAKVQEEAFARKAEATRRSHQEQLSALRAEIQAIRSECSEQVNVAALEFEERSAQQTDSMAALEAEKAALVAEKAALLEQLSRSHARESIKQAKLDELQRNLDSERTRLMEANRTVLALRQAAEAQARTQAQVHFQPASSLYAPLNVERVRQAPQQHSAPAQRHPPPPRQQAAPARRGRGRRKAFGSDWQQGPPGPRGQQGPPLSFPAPTPPPGTAASSLFTFKRRSGALTPRATAPAPAPAHPKADLLRYLSTLPASKQSWTFPSAPVELQKPRPRDEPPPQPPPLRRDLGEQLEATRRFFSSRSSHELGASPPHTATTSENFLRDPTELSDEDCDPFSPPVSPEPRTSRALPEPTSVPNLDVPEEAVIPPGEDLVEAGDDLVEASDELVEVGDDLVEANDDLVEAGDDVVEAGDAASSQGAPSSPAMPCPAHYAPAPSAADALVHQRPADLRLSPDRPEPRGPPTPESHEEPPAARVTEDAQETAQVSNASHDGRCKSPEAIPADGGPCVPIETASPSDRLLSPPPGCESSSSPETRTAGAGADAAAILSDDDCVCIGASQDGDGDGDGDPQHTAHAVELAAVKKPSRKRKLLPLIYADGEDVDDPLPLY